MVLPVWALDEDHIIHGIESIALSEMSAELGDGNAQFPLLAESRPKLTTAIDPKRTLEFV